MKESSLQQATYEGLLIVNNDGLAFKPQLIALANDFSLFDSYSGMIALPSAQSRKPHQCGYELIKYTKPAIVVPDTTLDDLWACTKEHYGLSALVGLTGAASIPIPKVMLGHKVHVNASHFTNIISDFGTRFFPLTTLPANTSVARFAKATFGTVRVFGVIGRAMPLVALGLAVFDVVSIGMCVYEAKHGK